MKALDHSICRLMMSGRMNMTSSDDVGQLGEEMALELLSTITCHDERTTKAENPRADKLLGHYSSR